MKKSVSRVFAFVLLLLSLEITMSTALGILQTNPGYTKPKPPPRPCGAPLSINMPC